MTKDLQPKEALGEALLATIANFSDTGVTVADVLGALEVAKFTVIHEELEVMYASDFRNPGQTVQ